MTNNQRSGKDQEQNGQKNGQQRQEEQSSGRGFASMDSDRQREIASMGGKASGGNFRNDPERAAEAGRKGGQNSQGGERGKNESSGSREK